MSLEQVCESHNPSSIASEQHNVKVAGATPLDTDRKRGPVVKRRFQKGSFRIRNGMAYSFYYEDVRLADGSLATRRVRRAIGRLGDAGLSERAARREHDRIMQEINRERGCVAPAVKGRTFNDAVAAWREAIAPTLSPSTVRQRECYLRKHILPKFKDSAPHTLDTGALQQFATKLRQTVSRKTAINILGAIFSVLDYAERTGTQVAKAKLADIRFGADTATAKGAAFFTREQAVKIIQAAEEPYRTMFAVAWATGLRAGELLALAVTDLDFRQKTISVTKSADDQNREIRAPKTPASVATLPMPSALESALKTYLAQHWQANDAGLLFPNCTGTKSRLRDNVVKYGLRPVLKQLGIPNHDVGLHAFRHGLASELAQQMVPLPDLQKQLRHTDVRTTLKIYAHSIPGTQRAAMETVAIGTTVPIGTN